MKASFASVHFVSVLLLLHLCISRPLLSRSSLCARFQPSRVAIGPALHIALRWRARSTALQAKAILVIRQANVEDSPSLPRTKRGERVCSCAHHHKISSPQKTDRLAAPTGMSIDASLSPKSSSSDFLLTVYSQSCYFLWINAYRRFVRRALSNCLVFCSRRLSCFRLHDHFSSN